MREIESRADANQRGKRRRRSGKLVAVANAALADVEGARARFVSAGRESAGPGNVIRIDVNDRGAGVNRRAAPLRASIESREDNGFRANRERNELTITVKFFEIVESPAMSLGRAVSEQVFCEALARKRNGCGG